MLHPDVLHPGSKHSELTAAMSLQIELGRSVSGHTEDI